MQPSASQRGFSLVELLVAMALGLMLLAAAVALFRQAMDLSYMVTQRAEMQQNARVAVNSLARDLSIAGTGLPTGGIQLPNYPGATASFRGCLPAPAPCGAWTYLGDNRLYYVTPGDGLGPVINGAATDVVTVTYQDPTLDLSPFSLQWPVPGAPPPPPPHGFTNAAGNQITFFSPASIAAIENPVNGLKVGDALMLTNTNGAGAAVVTQVVGGGSGQVNLGDDTLDYNQVGGIGGNIRGVYTPPNPPGTLPRTRVSRLVVVTYYIDIPPGPDGVTGTADDGAPRLMRQVNATPPVPLAENIENLQFSYDIYDDVAGVPTSNLANAGGVPNQIRKINITVGSRSPVRGLFRRGFERIALSTSVSARNLAFRDRYQ